MVRQRPVAATLVVLWGLLGVLNIRGAEGYWCVARSDASDEALQTALDYVCGAGGADCAPLQSTGLCYLPNTIQAHASYAFNSYYQRHNAAPGSCDFAGTANLAKTDPSFGSCVYPPNPSTAGVLMSGASGSSTAGSATPSSTTASTSPTITTNPISSTNPAGGTGFSAGSLSPPSTTSDVHKSSFQAAKALLFSSHVSVFLALFA